MATPRQSVVTALRASGLLVRLAGAAHGKLQLGSPPYLSVAMPRVSAWLAYAKDRSDE
jgi:hypothetical protein